MTGPVGTRSQVGLADVASEVLDMALRLLPVDGGAVLLMTGELRWITAAATDQTVAALVDLEEILADGPSLEAYRTGGPVLVPDLPAASARWPLLVPEVPLVRAYFSFPLQIGAVRLGVLDLYRHNAGGLDDADLGCVRRLVDYAARTLASRRDLDGLADPVSWPAFDRLVRPEVDQATGMLSVLLDVDMPTAYARLRAHTFAAGMSLSEVAAGIVLGSLHLDDERPPDLDA